MCTEDSTTWIAEGFHGSNSLSEKHSENPHLKLYKIRFSNSSSKQQKQQDLASWQTPQACGLVALYLPLGLSSTDLGRGDWAVRGFGNHFSFFDNLNLCGF